MARKRETPWEQAKRAADDQRKREELLGRLDGYSFMKRFQLAQREYKKLGDALTAWASTAQIRDETKNGLISTYVRIDEDIPEDTDAHLTFCIESLASTLDQLVLALAEKHSGPLTEAQERTPKFPIHRTPVHPNDQGAWRGIALVSPEASRTIRSLQPLTAFPKIPSHSPLFRLTDLAERSKHRRGLTQTAVTATTPHLGDGFYDHFEGFSPDMVVGEEHLILRRGVRNNANFRVHAQLRTRLNVPGAVMHGALLQPTLVEFITYIQEQCIDRLAPRLV